MVHDGEALSWAELALRATRRARALIALGVQPNDLVSICLPNGNAFFENLFAIWMAGATPNPLSPRLPSPELEAILALARPRVVIGGDSSARALRLPSDWDGEGESTEPLAPVAATHWKAMASGGSTGQPKLILDQRPALTDPERYDLFPAHLAGGRLGRVGGVMLNPGPLYHNGPFVHAVSNLLAGSTVVGMVRFDAEETLRLIEAHAVELAYLVPTMMSRIWNLPQETRERYDLSSLTAALHMAAPCPAWLKRAWIDWLGPERVWEAYGATEAQASTLISGQEWLERPGSVGCFFTGRGQILDESGAPLPPGQVGELWVQPEGGSGSTYVYIGAEPRSRDGWDSLGDMGSMDADGYLYLADRRADLILRGGANIYPAEVEAVIEAHPDVISAIVIGLPDPDLGARVHAIVQARARGIDPAALDAFVRARIAKYKAPASYEITDAPLRDDAGKARRLALLAERAGPR